jgi:hypothetical protein
MKLQIGTRYLDDVFQQLARWFPARSAELAKIREACVLGVQIDVAPLKRKHTSEQQRAYWKFLHEVGRHLGYSARETETLLHDAMLVECFGSAGAKQMRVRGEVYSWPVPAERSSKDADGRARDVETYSALIETLLRVAAEHGYLITIGDAV